MFQIHSLHFHLCWHLCCAYSHMFFFAFAFALHVWTRLNFLCHASILQWNPDFSKLPITGTKSCFPWSLWINKGPTVVPNNPKVPICYNKVMISFTVFIQLNAAAFIKFFVIQVRRLFEGGVYLKSNLFLANNSMVIEHLHFEKQKHILVHVWKVIFYFFVNFTNYHCGVYSRGCLLFNVSALNCRVHWKLAFNWGRRLIEEMRYLLLTSRHPMCAYIKLLMLIQGF